MANPPFNLSNWGADKLREDVRWTYGIPPAGNANFAWLQHMIWHMAPGGRIGMVLANGSLSSQSGGEGDIRRNMIEANLVDCILTLGRYVGIEEQEDDGEPFEEKMGRLTAELSDLFAQSHNLEDEIRKQLGAIGYGI